MYYTCSICGHGDGMHSAACSYDEAFHLNLDLDEALDLLGTIFVNDLCQYDPKIWFSSKQAREDERIKERIVTLLTKHGRSVVK